MNLRRLAPVCALLLLPLASPAQPASRPFNAEAMLQLKQVSEPVLSPDGTQVVYNVRSIDLNANRGQLDLWSLDVTQRDAVPRQLTTHPQNDYSAQWSRDGRWLYFLSSRSGSTQLWRLPAAGGEARQVTNLPLDVTSYQLSPAGSHLAVTLDVFADCDDLACTAQRLEQTPEDSAQAYERLLVRHWDTWNDGRISQLFVLALDEPDAPVPVSAALDADVPSKPFGDASEYTFSPDGSKLVFSARVKGNSEAWSTNFDLYEVGIDGSGLRNLTQDNPAWDTQPVFSPDGQWLAWRAMQRPGFEADRFHIMLANMRNGEQRALTAEWDRSVSSLAFSRDGRSLYVTADHLGQHPLWSVDVGSGKPTMLTGPGQVTGFSVGEKDIVLSVSSLKSPAELQVLTLRGGNLRELPKMNAEALASLAMGEPEQFTFVGANDETVYGYVMKPAGFRAGQRYPVAFIVHGGPQVSFSNQWSYRWNPQTYAGAGYAVVFIDFHGSPGYGQAFTDSISQDWGGKPLEDLRLGLAAALENYDWLDESRMCALGASYGGYMVNWIAGNWSEPFKCLVNHAGIFDTRSMAYTTEELWFVEWENGGAAHEAAARETADRWNPMNHVEKWDTPTLVIHGLKDYRVPYIQGLGTFTALQRRGIDSKLVIFPDENHWILRPSNSLRWHREVTDWLDRWIGRNAGAQSDEAD